MTRLCVAACAAKCRLQWPNTAPTGYVTCTHLPPPALAVLLPFAAGTASSSRGWLLGRFADCGDAFLSLEELPLPALFFALFVFFLLELLPSGSSRSALAPPPPPLLDLDRLPAARLFPPANATPSETRPPNASHFE